MSTDEFGGVAVEEPPKDEFGGVAVGDEFGGIPVDVAPEPHMPTNDAGPAPYTTPGDRDLNAATAVEDTIDANIIGALGGVMDYASEFKPLASKAHEPSNQAEFDRLTGKITELQSQVQKPGLSTIEADRLGNQIQLAYYYREQLGKSPRSETIAGHLGDVAQAYRESAQAVPGAAGSIGRGVGNVASAIPLTIGTGGAGLGLATAQQVVSAESATRADVHKQLIAQGIDEATADEMSKASGSEAGLKAALTMPAYLLAGKGGAALTTKLLGKTATPLATGVGGLVGAAATNMATSATLRAIEGENPAPTLENASQDVLWGIVHAVPEFAHASAVAKQRASAELQRRGKAAEDIVSDLKKATSEVTGLAKATGLLSAGEPNAQQIDQTGTPDGGLRPRGEIPIVPTSEGGQGVQPSGQGNGTTEQGLARGAPDETQQDIAPDYDPEDIGAKQWIANRVAQGVTREQAVAEQSAQLDATRKWQDDLPVGTKIKRKGDGKVFTKVDDQTFLADDGSVLSGAARGAEVVFRPSVKSENLGPGAANVQEFTPGERLGAYNTQIDEQRAARGLPPLMSEARKPNPQLWDDAVARVERDPEEPAMLTNEINSGKKKSVSDEEQSMLLYRIVDLHNRMDTEAQRVLDPNADEADRTEARVKYERLEQERQATEEADRKAGTASGRSLQARKIMADENYNFAGIMKRVGIASREPITPEQTVQIKADAEKVKVAKDKLDEETAKVEGEKEITKVKGTKAEVPLDEQRAKIATHLEAEQQKGTSIDDLKSFIQKLAENSVKSGVTEINALTTAVHGVVEPIFKGITPRAVRDLFSNYGDFHALDKDPLKTELRRLRSEGQSVSKLEDVQSGKAPSKTGVERQAPSDLKRRLEKEVRETMKKNGITTTDPATQLKSSLDARKTAMKNQIKDLTFQIETGEKPKSGEPPPSDAELEGLRKLRNNVRETLHAIEGDPKMTDEQRTKLVIAQLDRQIAEHQRIIDSGAVRQEGGKLKPLNTPEIEARRAVRDSLKAQVDEIRAADQTAREEREFDATMARADELEKKLASGDLSTKGGKELGPDTELVAAAKERLAKLQKELSERRKALRPKATEEERQLSTLERQKEDLQRRLDTGDLSTRGPKLGPDTQKVAAAKAEVQKLRDEIKSRRDALNPKKTVEEIQLARLEKAADDLEERLTKGDLARKEKAPTVDTKEISEAKDRLAALRDQLKAARAASPEATQAKLDASKAAVEESIAKLDKRIQAEDFTSSKKAQPTTPEIEALRAERDTMRRLFNELKAATLPKLTPEQRAQKALATRLAKRTAELQAKLAAGDFTKPPPRKPTPLTPALLKAKAAYEDAKLQVDRGIEKLRLKNRTFTEKGADMLAKWTRASILSGPITLAKLTAAAAYRVAAIPAEEIAGTALRRVFPRAAARAPYEGRGFEPGLEAKAVAKGVTRGLMDAWKTIKTGHGNLDAAFGKKDIAPRSLLDIFGAIHGALKAPVKRTFFERSMAKRIASASEAGVDVTDPAVQTQIIADAYKDAQRSIFMQDNRVSSLVSQMAARLEAPDRKTGEVSVLGKAGATALRVALPVVKVPTNIVAEIFQHVFGLPYGLGRLAGEYARGIEKLQPDEADAIFRSMKKGSLGTAMLLYGFFSPNQFGGQFAPGLKKREDEPGFGEMKVGQTKVPKFLIHNPLLETAQVGATIRHVMDQKIKGKTQGLMTGIGRGLLGAVEEAPQFDESVRLAHLTEQNGPTKYFGELARSIGVPQLVQQIARWTDSKKRKPETFTDFVKEGVPGLRQTVPVKP